MRPAAGASWSSSRVVPSALPGGAAGQEPIADTSAANTHQQTRQQEQAAAYFKYRGVHRVGSGRYVAQIKQSIGGGKAKNLHLGTFDTALEAARAYDAKALQLGGAHRKLNFPHEHAQQVGGSHGAARKHKKSLYVGVHWRASRGKWQAVVYVERPGGKRVWRGAGLHRSELAAAQAYNRLAWQLLGPAARLNDVPDDIDDAAAERRKIRRSRSSRSRSSGGGGGGRSC